MHDLDRQLNVGTADLDPLNYGFLQENGNLLPSTSWRSLEPRWSVMCPVRQMCSRNLSLPDSYGKMQRILQVSEDREL